MKAVQRWAELTEERRVAGPKFTFMDLTHDYRAKVLPSKASRTQEDNTEELEWLIKLFGNPPAPLDDVEPIHISQYLDWRIDATRKAAEAQNVKRAKKNQPPLPIPPAPRARARQS